MKEEYQGLCNLLSKDKLQKADVVIWLQGDRYKRSVKVLRIYKSKLVKKIVISGNNILIGPNTRLGEDNISLYEMKNYLLRNSVNIEDIIVDDKSMNTKEQAVNITKLAKLNQWKKVILVGSAEYQPRAFLTFVKAINNIGYTYKIINQIIQGDNNPRNINITKTITYQKKGDVASYNDGMKFFYKNSEGEEKVKFRRATINDLNNLFKWRNDSLTRKFSINTRIVNKNTHTKWLNDSLRNKQRKIYIFEIRKTSIGMVRVDASKGETEMSWIVSPNFRNMGIGKIMVEKIMNITNGSICAKIKMENEASKCIAKHCGMKYSHKDNGVLVYYKDKTKINEN